MIPSFSGPDRARQINLGGSRSTYSQETILNTVKQQREQRLDLRRRQESVLKLQAWWRGTSEAKRFRNELNAQFDRTRGPVVGWTRLLVLGWSGSDDDQLRLAQWSQAMLSSGSDGLFQPYQSPEAESWQVLLRQLSLLILKSNSQYPQSSHAPSHLKVLSLLLSKEHSQATQLLAYLLDRGYYPYFATALLGIPPEAKSAPSVPSIIQLIVLPFTLLQSDSALFALALTQLFQHIFTIPILPNRLPLETLGIFSSKLPLSSLHLITDPGNLTATLDPPTAKIHLLANLVAFVPYRLPKLPTPALCSYIHIMSLLMELVPAGSLEPTIATSNSASWHTTDDSDDSDVEGDHGRAAHSKAVTQTPASVLLQVYKVDSRTYTRLLTLPSPKHITTLLSLTSKLSDARPLVFRFLINLCSVWTDRKEKIFSMILVSKSGPLLVKELWRDWIRRSPLGKESRGQRGLEYLMDPSFTNVWPPLLLLVDLYTHALLTMGDDEFFSTNTNANSPRNPLSLDELTALSRQLLNIALPLYWQEDQDTLREGGTPSADGVGVKWITVREKVTKCLRAVHSRDSRRKFTPEGHWLLSTQIDIQSFAEAAIYEEQKLDRTPLSQTLSKRQMAYISPRLGILNNIPFAIPFSVRVEIFRRFVWNDMRALDLDHGMFSGAPRHRAVVRRGQVAKDGYDNLNGLGAALKERIQITFVDQFGNEESGIDGGGVFKEFLTSLSKEAFDTDRGLWLATKRQELYPNPHSYATEQHQLNWYRFIGRVLGKALYEGILIDVAFATFFLSKWLGKPSYLDDLASLDPELYQGLTFLKHYDGKVEDLALNFTVTNDEFGAAQSVNLVPNGSNIPVTKENRLQYIHLVSNYRLNTQIKSQGEAFFEGLSDIIDPKWLRMFNQQELQVLIGGTEEPIDIDDLRRNTVYGGLYGESHETVEMFWRVVRSLNAEQTRALLRFTTSCSRPPLLGFKELNPKFSIRDAGSDNNRLPTASTCVNLLKLPRYTNEYDLRRKLLQAINSGAGFDLS